MSSTELIEINANQLSPKSFSVDVEKVKKTVETYALMQVNGIDDKKGLKAVREARLDLRRIRIDIEKRGKQLRDDSNAYSKKVIQVEKELVALVAPTEELLCCREEAVESEIRLKAAWKLKDRMDQLAAYQSVIPATAIEPMSEAEFTECLSYSKGLYEERQEAARVAAEAEAKRLADEAAAKASEEKRLKEDREKLEAEQAKFRAEQEEQARKIKVQQDAIDAENAKLAEAKRKSEAEAAEQRRQQELEQARQEAAEQARKDESARIERQRILEEEAAEDARKESERREALKPDREKLLAYAELIDMIAMPELKSDDAQKVADSINGELKYLARQLRGLIDNL